MPGAWALKLSVSCTIMAGMADEQRPDAPTPKTSGTPSPDAGHTPMVKVSSVPPPAADADADSTADFTSDADAVAPGKPDTGTSTSSRSTTSAAEPAGEKSAPGKSNPVKKLLLTLAALSTGVMLAVVTAVVVGVLLIGMLLSKGLGALPDWANPFDSTTTVTSEQPLQLSLRDLAEYHAAVGTYQVVVKKVDKRKNLPSFIGTDATTALAQGTVDGIVDFTGLADDRLTVNSAAKSVAIRLPAPRLGAATLDLEKTQILDRDRGLISRAQAVAVENPLDDAAIYREAEAKIAEVAQQGDLLERAKENTRRMLTELAQSLGYTVVQVSFD